jgi:hypothetical protein
VLDELPPAQEPQHQWPLSIRQHGDIHIGLDDIGFLVGQAIVDTMHAPPPAFVPQLAQVLLPNEEPWVTRRTPLPDDDSGAWPTEPEIGDWERAAKLVCTS